ncbi:coiled-coil domain-containing protein 80 [Protopterus annectens]|uniref:coiled-coil domain-containing protein 80 n=1 Tax=Protopterus annectens TaxID=7888 RepID=UPI001CFB4A60|nr:coiled-coil domain-containing protein 80 [Protopterus annectens]
MYSFYLFISQTNCKMNQAFLLSVAAYVALAGICVSQKMSAQGIRENTGVQKLTLRHRLSRPLIQGLHSSQRQSNATRLHSLQHRTVSKLGVTPSGQRQPVIQPLSQVRNSNVRTVQSNATAMVRHDQDEMVKDESTPMAVARSRVVRMPTTSRSSPNILARFAGKHRLWVISAPHASDGYYRLMLSLLKDDVYCELAERHIQQLVIFHEEGEVGGKIRKITDEGKIVEEPLDPSFVPRLMSYLKLEKGKFGMVLLKKTLQVEEKYPYPVRLEAIFEVVDQSPIRRIEKVRQKGFVQKCKTYGVEGQVIEAGHQEKTVKHTESPKPTQSNENILVTTGKKVEGRPDIAQIRKEIRKKIMAKKQMQTAASRTTTKTTSTTLPTSTSTTVPTTVPTTTTTTRTTTQTTTTTTRAPTTKTTTTQKTWAARMPTTGHSGADFYPTPVVPDVIRSTEVYYTFTRRDRHRNRQHGSAGRNSVRTSRFGKTTTLMPTESYTVTTTTFPTTAFYARLSTDRYGDNLIDRRDYSRRNPSVSPTQHKPTRPKTTKKKTDRILTNEYEDKYDVNRPTATNVAEEETVASIPQKKGKDQKKHEKDIKKKKKNDKVPKGDKLAKKIKSENKLKLVKEPKADHRNVKKNKKTYKNENDEKPPENKPSLFSFLDYFTNKRRLILITTPSEENEMYVQQRDEYLEAVCEMSLRKISIITIFGPFGNSTMKVDHFQVDNEKHMKVLSDDDLLNQDLITELRKEYGMSYDDFFMILTDLDLRVKQYYEVPITMKAVFEYIDTFSSRIKEMERQKREGISCKKEERPRSLENFLSRFRWRRRLLVISAPNDEEWGYQHQISALSGQACNLGLRHVAIMRLVGDSVDNGGILELFSINGSGTVEREEIPYSLIHDIRNYFQLSREYFIMLLVGKDGNVKSWYPSPIGSMAIVYDLIDSMQLRRQEMAIQQSLNMRCPEDEYAGYAYPAYHHGYQDDYHHRSDYYHGYHYKR